MSPPDPQRVVVLVGLPGCGKSTWLEDQDITALSSDEIRRWLTDDATNQSIHGMVFATIRQLLRRRLTLGRPVTYIDATSLTPRERRAYIKTAHLFGAEAEAVFFDVPAAVCQQRNAARHRIVPPEVIERMAAKLVPPSLAEGFARIRVITEQAQRENRPRRDGDQYQHGRECGHVADGHTGVDQPAAGVVQRGGAQHGEGKF